MDKVKAKRQLLKALEELARSEISPADVQFREATTPEAMLDSAMALVSGLIWRAQNEALPSIKALKSILPDIDAALNEQERRQERAGTVPVTGEAGEILSEIKAVGERRLHDLLDLWDTHISTLRFFVADLSLYKANLESLVDDLWHFGYKKKVGRGRSVRKIFRRKVQQGERPQEPTETLISKVETIIRALKDKISGVPAKAADIKEKVMLINLAGDLNALVAELEENFRRLREKIGD